MRTTYVYDDVGQQTSRQYQDTTRVTQTFDAVGQRTVLWDSTGRTTTTYDDVGQVTNVKNPANKTITYSYYDDGLRNVTTEPGGGLFTYTYDNAGQMTVIKNPQNDLTTFEYDDAGRRTVIRRQNGARTSLIYDNASQLTNLLHRNSGGTVLASYTYTYDNAGIRTQVAENGPVTVVWGYDNAYRLTSERRNDLGGLLYADTMTYDDVGNRTLLHNASGRTTYTYDDANQLETAVLNTTRTTYTYDANGNLQVELTGTSRTTNTWDDENRLTQVEFPGGSPTTNQYTFNGDGQRVQIVDSQGTKKPIWDFENILLESDGSNVTQVVYTLEPAKYGNLISQRRGSTTSFYLFDALGSTRKLTNSASTVTDGYDFRAYGETFASSGTTVNVFRWIGELGYYFDVDRLAFYLRARAYSPKIARFLSRDPLGLSSENSYCYVSSAPAIYTDPSGMQPSPPSNGNPDGWPPEPPRYWWDIMRDRILDPHRMCNGRRYRVATHCCDNGNIVAKVRLWHCSRNANIPFIGIFIPHHYICCDGPNGARCFGLVPGNIAGLQVSEETTRGGTCEERLVCPSSFNEKCNNPIAPADWRVFPTNCYWWANVGGWRR